MYMLSIFINNLRCLRDLREEILNQLGKTVVKYDLCFDVGYFSGSRKILFTEKDSMKTELDKVTCKGKSLWCEGLPDTRLEPVTVDSDSDDDNVPVAKKRKLSAYDSKVQRVDSLANELRQKHSNKYTKIQYKLWAEALDVNRHGSQEVPPPGPIWNTTDGLKSKKSTNDVSEMASAFTTMAKSVATAFKPNLCTSEDSTPTKQSTALSGVGISPGRRIDLQQKLLNQLDMLHKIFERGALTSDQYEKRREDLLSQLDNL